MFPRLFLFLSPFLILSPVLHLSVYPLLAFFCFYNLGHTWRIFARVTFDDTLSTDFAVLGRKNRFESREMEVAEYKYIQSSMFSR